MHSKAYVRVEQLVAEALRRGIPNWQALEESLEDPEEKAALRSIREQRNPAETAATPPPGKSAHEEILPSEAIPGGATSPLDAASDPSATFHHSATATRRAWGKLIIVRELGKGAFGDVFLAQDPDLDREVALKLFRAADRSRSPLLSRADSARGRQAMVREARLMARVRHPNVVTIYGAEEIAGEAGIWMDFIQGETLHDVVTRQGRLGAQEAVLIGLDLCRALAALHARGIVHRDIKAQNVMREEGGRIVLMDFGVGIEVQAPEGAVEEVPAGTPLYMAPEMLLQGSASPASDQYALGVLLFFLVTGDYPVAGKIMPELLQNHRTGRRRLLRDVRPDLPLSFVEVVERANSPEPSARFASMGEMEQALAGVLGTVRPTGRGWTAKNEHGTPVRTGFAALRRRLIPSFRAVLIPVLALIAASAGVFYVKTTRHVPRHAPLPRQITFHGLASGGEISPDGKTISYITLDPSTSWSLLVQDVNGAPPRKLHDGAINTLPLYPRWNPNGRAVVMRVFGETDSLAKGIFSFPREGGDPTTINSKGAYFAISPEGDRMAASAQSWNGRYGVRKLPAGEPEAYRISGRTDWLRSLDWGGPGGQLLFVEKRKSTGAMTILVADPGAQDAAPVWSDSSGIVVAEVRWAPTRNAIYMLRARGPYARPDLFKVDLTKKPAERRAELLLSGLGLDSFSASADGRRLALTRAEDRGSIWLFTFDPSQGVLSKRRLVTGSQMDADLEVSPDGRSLVFCRTRNDSQIYTMAIDGTNEIQVTHEKNGALFPSWSPDGRSLAYLSQVRDTLQVCVVPVDGGNRRVFRRSAGSQGLKWSRSGPILYQRPGNRNFNILDPVTEQERPLVKADSVGWMFCPCVAPDGHRLAVVWNRPPGQSLWMIDLETGAERRLASANLEPLAWSPDGTRIWVVERGLWSASGSATITKLERMSIADGSVEETYDLPFNAEQTISGMAMASDESFFVVSAAEVQSDIWIVDNFDPDVR